MSEDKKIFNSFLLDAFNLSKTKMSNKDEEQVKKILIDYLSVVYSGYHSYKSRIDKYIDNQITSHNIFKKIENLEIFKRAFVLGTSAHALDMDDGVNDGIIHLGSPIISAILSLYEKYEFSWKKFMHATITGYEVALRISQTIQPSHKFMGFHSTGTCGTIGAAAAVAVLMKLNYDKFANAISIAASSASGLLKVIEGDSHLKAVNVGRAAMNGVNSAILSEADFESPADFYFGTNGFFSTYSNDVNFEKLVIKSEDLAIHKVYTKKYAACRYCHPSIDLALNVKNNNLDIKLIKEINIYTYKVAIKNHDHNKITGIASAKMSIPYSFAVALKNGSAGINDFDEKNINHEEIIDLLNKITVHESIDFSNLFPVKTPASADIILSNNQLITETVYVPKGEPENPLSENDLYNKFFELLYYSKISKTEIDKIYYYIKNKQVDMKQLMEMLIVI